MMHAIIAAQFVNQVCGCDTFGDNIRRKQFAAYLAHVQGFLAQLD